MRFSHSHTFLIVLPLGFDVLFKISLSVVVVIINLNEFC